MGVLYKATILSHCMKAGKQEYKIHYNGNKKFTTVHWIPEDQVNKSLMDDDDVDISCCNDDLSGTDHDKQGKVLESEEDDKDPATETTIVPNIDKDIVIKCIGDRQNHFEYSESAGSVLLKKIVDEIIKEYLKILGKHRLLWRKAMVTTIIDRMAEIITDSCKYLMEYGDNYLTLRFDITFKKNTSQ